MVIKYLIYTPQNTFKQMKVRIINIKQALTVLLLMFATIVHAQSTGKHLTQLNAMKGKYETARKNSYTFFSEYMKKMEDGYLLDREYSEQILLDCIEYWKECIAEGHDEVVIAIYRESNDDELTDDEFKKISNKSRACPEELYCFYDYLLHTNIEATGDGEVEIYDYSVRNENKKFYWYYSKAVTDVVNMSCYFDAKTDITHNDLSYSDNRCFTVHPDNGAELEGVVRYGYDLTSKTNTFQLFDGPSYKITFSTLTSISDINFTPYPTHTFGIEGKMLSNPSSTKGLRIIRSGNKTKKVFSPSNFRKI